MWSVDGWQEKQQEIAAAEEFKKKEGGVNIPVPGIDDDDDDLN